MNRKLKVVEVDITDLETYCDYFIGVMQQHNHPVGEQFAVKAFVKAFLERKKNE